MKTAAIAIKSIEKTSAVIFWAQVGLIVAMISMYMYLVNKTVWNVVARQQAESSIVSLNSKLSDLEFQYITSKNNITLEMAQSLGYESTHNTVFVTRDQAAAVALR
ncbi:MAG: hypothetical protein RL094_444 [Candidatus Parcubacteria bacterium]|jgi:hypothetical protein